MYIPKETSRCNNNECPLKDTCLRHLQYLSDVQHRNTNDLYITKLNSLNCKFYIETNLKLKKY